MRFGIYEEFVAVEEMGSRDVSILKKIKAIYI